jgi:hypothetical protein
MSIGLFGLGLIELAILVFVGAVIAGAVVFIVRSGGRPPGEDD